MKTGNSCWRMTMVAALAVAMLPLAAGAQAARLKMPDFSSLAAKAKESVDIDMDQDMLKNAMGFMAGDKADPQLTEALKGLEHLTVKVFSFDKPGVYSQRDLEGVVNQVESGGWKKLMSVRDGEERVEMWMRDGTKDGGMFFVAAEPKELVLINIAGKVDLATLAKLQGHLGMPNMGLGKGGPLAPPAPPAAPAQFAPAAPPAN